MLSNFIKNIVKSAIKEMVLPEFDSLRAEVRGNHDALVITNKRLDDMNAQMIEMSRRIDKINSDLNLKIDKVNFDLNSKIDKVNSDLVAKIDKVNSDLIARIDDINRRIDSLYEVVVRRDEHEKLDAKVASLERDVAEIKHKLAA